jgi:hypothetical protein
MGLSGIAVDYQQQGVNYDVAGTITGGAFESIGCGTFSLNKYHSGTIQC